MLGENVRVLVVSIICDWAKDAGKQYSKRILPPFVIPYCQISREGVVAYLGQFPDGRFVHRVGREVLGARDGRTIRRHIRIGLATSGAAGQELVGLLSEVSAHATLSERRLGESARECLQDLAKQMDRAGRRPGGRSGSGIPPMVYLHLVSVFERSAGAMAIPLSCVLRAVLLHDTS